MRPLAPWITAAAVVGAAPVAAQGDLSRLLVRAGQVSTTEKIGG